MSQSSRRARSRFLVRGAYLYRLSFAMFSLVCCLGMPISWAQEKFRDCSDCPQMVVIEPGTFVMGSPDDEEGRTSEREGPTRTVTIPYRFAMGRYEVTVGEFGHFVQATGYETDAERDVGHPGCFAWHASDKTFSWRPGTHWRNPGFPQDQRHPAVCLSWNDAQAYVNWISQRTGRVYRLPSEAEWEYAARAGSSASRPWGPDTALACQYANVADETTGPADSKWDDRHPCSDGYFFTAPVGSYQPNAFGLNDMIGNAWEWTQDCYKADAYTHPLPDSKTYELPNCTERGVRGGAWYSSPKRARAAYRGGYAPESRINLYGFRLVTILP